MDKSPRQITMERLNKAIMLATAGELHRAADLLEFAIKVREGKRGMRNSSRKEHATSRMRKVDKPLGW
jgi:hypothetical protein